MFEWLQCVVVVEPYSYSLARVYFKTQRGVNAYLCYRYNTGSDGYTGIVKEREGLFEQPHTTFRHNRPEWQPMRLLLFCVPHNNQV